MAHKILIAEDDVLALKTFKVILNEAEGDYICLVARNGKEVMDITLKEHPHLILMDWQMPEMTGIQALKALKSNPLSADIPVIMTTGDEGSERLNEALTSGAVDFIRKPPDKIELIARVNSALLLYDSFLKIKTQNEKIQHQIVELERLSLIAKETDNSVMLLSSNLDIEWVNAGFKRMYGCNRKEYISKYGKKIYSTSESIETTQVIEDIQKNKKPSTYQTVIETKLGEFKWVQSRLTPILDADKNIKKFIAIETDITKLKEAERELTETNVNLRKFATRLQEINNLQEKENEKINKEKLLIEQNKKKVENEKLIIESEKKIIEDEKLKTEKLLLNILPENVAIQLKSSGAAKPRNYRTASVLFTDFKGFTMSCESLSPKELVHALHSYFVRFDDIVENHFIEKIKTIGDAYMCVGGLPIRNRSNPFDVVLAGLEIQALMKQLEKIKDEVDMPVWKLRLGIHTGPVVAGVVGKRKFAYDIWGDTVNIASRMESSGEVGEVNISGTTYNFIKDYFDCVHRGKIDAKNKGKIDMYFVKGLKAEYAHDEERVIPNSKFQEILNNL